MAKLFAVLALCLSLLFSVLEAKTVVGRLRTDINALTDIYLGNFIFDARGGTVGIKSHSDVQGQRFLFFDESKGSWSEVLSLYTELSCEQLSKMSLLVTEDAQDGTITEGISIPKGDYSAELQIAPTALPKRWYAMLSNCNDRILIDFDLIFENPGGTWYRQFSVDEQGLLQMYLFFAVLYSALLLACWRLIWQLYRSQSMHTLVWLLLGGILMEYLYLIFESLHGLAYSEDGIGLTALQAIGEVCDAASQIVVMFTLTLLSKGWTITSHSTPLPKEWVAPISFGFIGYFGLYILERVAREIDHKYCYDSNIGAFALLLRAGFCGYFLWCLRRSHMEETQLHRRVFLQKFGVAATVWFLSLPLIYLISNLFVVFYWRMRVVLLVSCTVHTLSLGALGWVIWPRGSSGGGDGGGRGGEYFSIAPNDMLAGVEPYDEI